MAHRKLPSTRGKPCWSPSRMDRLPGRARRASTFLIPASSAIGRFTPTGSRGSSNGGPVNYDAARIFLTNKAIPTEDGAISSSHPWPRHQPIDRRWSARRSRHHQQQHEACPLSARGSLSLRLRRCLRSEIRSYPTRGQITTEWSAGRRRVRTVYSNRDSHRAVTTSVARPSSKAVSANGRLSFDVALQPGEAWPVFCSTRSKMARKNTMRRAIAWERSAAHHSETTADWLKTVAKIATRNEEFLPPLSPGAGGHGGASFTNQGHEHEPHGVHPCRRTAMVRGSIWSRQPARFTAECPDLSGIRPWRIGIIGFLQAKEDDPFATLNRARSCMSSASASLRIFKQIPHTPYYGTARVCHTAYLITFHAAWKGLGDNTLLEHPLGDGGGLPQIDRPLRQSRRRRLSGVSNTLERWLRDVAWKDASDVGHVSGWLASKGAQGAL